MRKVNCDTKDSAAVSTNQNSTYQPKIYVGSAGICFLAEVAAIKAQLDAQDEMSQMQCKSASAMMLAAQSSADATKNSYNDDADVLEQNANSSYASIASSATQVMTAGTGLVREGRSVSASNRMSNLSDEVQNHKLTTTNTANAVGNLPSAAGNETKIEEYRNLLTNAKKGGRGLGSETYESIARRAEKLGKSPLEVDIKEGEGITLKHVLDTSDDTALSLMKEGMKAECKTHDAHLESKRRDFESKKSMVEQSIQAAVVGAQANMKTKEAELTRDKAEESAVQALEQNLSQNLASIASKQADAANQSFQAAQSGWSTISQMVQVDTRA